MTLKQIIKNLETLSAKGFVRSLRRGPTGIGFMLEKELGLQETNIPIPDIGGRVELKATRKTSNSLITLFTFNRGVWRIKQKELIERFGYTDDKGRTALYNIAGNRIPNSQGFYLGIDVQKNLVTLKNNEFEGNIAEWSSYVIAGKFMIKLDRLILVYAESREIDGFEHFHFNEAYLLENPTPEKFLSAFEKNEMFIDLRMHIKPDGGVRNHGTAFRISEKSLSDLYSKKQKLI